MGGLGYHIRGDFSALDTSSIVAGESFPRPELSMSDETALLRAIAAHPDEDTPRLAFADYIEERGNADRAAFIRGQIELASLKDDSPRRREVAFRCRQLLDAHEEKWLEPRAAFKLDWGWSRGFVETFSTTPTDLHLRDAQLFATHPFRRVWVREWEGGLNGTALLPPDNHITALDLIGNNLNVTQLKKLAKMKHLPHLRELGVMFNALRDTSVKVLCGEPFFQHLELIRLGANPFTDRGRDQLRAHFGKRVTFEHDREPERLYAIQDDYLQVGWGNNCTQLFILGSRDRVLLSLFDHVGDLLSTEERPVEHAIDANHHTRIANLQTVRDKWLAELGYRSATIKVKAFRFPNGAGITPFNWWAEAYDGRHEGQRPGLETLVERWLTEGKYRFNFVGNDAWFDRTGEVTDT
jgi:uncharacterized protein (TIGR02996 family)